MIDSSVRLLCAKHRSKCPASLNFRRENFKLIERVVGDNPDRNLTGAEAISEIYLHFKTIAGIKIGEILKCDHRFIRV